MTEAEVIVGSHSEGVAQEDKDLEDQEVIMEHKAQEEKENQIPKNTSRHSSVRSAMKEVMAVYSIALSSLSLFPEDLT